MAERSWVRQLREVSDSPIRLVCFPHSGGSAAAYRPWIAEMADTSLFAVQYPGHGDRMAEPLVASVQEMAHEVAGELNGSTSTVLFGHSLGALVAFETALALQDTGWPTEHLFVAGCRPPTTEGGGTHLRDDDALWAEVAAMGGMAPEIETDPEMRELFLPVLRADVRASETYQPDSARDRLNCPVRAYFGQDDPLVGEASVRAWEQETDGPYSQLEIVGGHFPEQDGLVQLITDLRDTAQTELGNDSG